MSLSHTYAPTTDHAGARPAAARDVRHWYRDPVSCLQTTLATVLSHVGEDPLAALGLSWEFRYVPGDVRPEEYYWPCRFPGDLARSVLPYHDVTSQWRPLPADDPLGPPAEALAEGRLPILAVDNFHLPYRPAYRDVHAAHLVVVHAIDRDAGTVAVSDAIPPAHRGALPIDVVLRSCRSDNPPDTQDRFFSGRPSGGRWLDVRLRTPGPPLDRDRLRSVLSANLELFAGGHPATGPDGGAGGHWTGLDGLDRFAGHLTSAASRADRALLGECYTYGWSAQAQAALHGELLRRCAVRWDLPVVGEAGRRVERVAHHWTPVRVTAAHSATGTADPQRLPRHVERLVATYRDAISCVEQAVAAL